MGVTIYTGRALGRDFSISDLFDRGYQAVFLGLGVGAGAALSVPGSDKQGVLIGLDFLKAVKRGNAPEVGKKVIVIGGGSVAVDVAATAVRLGAEEVRMVCLETRENMPAGYEDLKEAEEEGVMVADGWGIESVTGSEKADGVNLIRCVSVFDENGAFHPVYDETAREHLEADTIISAIGQKADLSCLNGEEAKKLVDGGRIDADELTCETGYAGVFAGGDAVTGIKDVVTAAQAGKEAAESIDRYLRGVSQERPPKAERYGQFWKPDCINKPTETMIKPEEEGSSRRRAQMVAPEIRKTNFEEISMTLTKEQAVSEARRCLKYDLNLEAESEERLANAGIATPLLDKRLTGEEW